MKDIDWKGSIDAMYNGDDFWRGCVLALILVTLIPIVLPTRIVYRLFMAIKEYGL